jgi:hypothetical protein
MDMLYIPAVASFSGSASGTLASIVTGWLTRRRRDRARIASRTLSQREELYKSFIDEASRLYADALVSDKSEISKLVDLFALIGRMKILSSDEVIEAAEKAGRLIVDTYLSPKREFDDLPELLNGMDPFRGFSNACRRELQAAHRRSGVSMRPLLRYFGWVGSVLLVALLAVGWWFSGNVVDPPLSGTPLRESIHVRIHVDHQWPERTAIVTTRELGTG